MRPSDADERRNHTVLFLVFLECPVSMGEGLWAARMDEELTHPAHFRLLLSSSDIMGGINSKPIQMLRSAPFWSGVGEGLIFPNSQKGDSQGKDLVISELLPCLLSPLPGTPHQPVFGKLMALDL